MKTLLKYFGFIPQFLGLIIEGQCSQLGLPKIKRLVTSSERNKTCFLNAFLTKAIFP